MIFRFLNKQIAISIIFLLSNIAFSSTNLWVYYNDGNNWIGDTLVVKENLQLYGDFTVPDGKTLKVYNGYLINIPSDYTLTINGAIDAGSYKIFEDEHIYTSSGIAGNPKVKFINPVWWGLGSGETEAEFMKLQRSINLAANFYDGYPGGLVKVPLIKSEIKLEDTVVIKRGVILDGQWNNFIATQNNDVFHVQDTAQLKNVHITHAELESGYTENYVTLKPAAHMKGNNSGLWLSGLKAEFQSNTGNAVVFDGFTYYIQGAVAKNIECYNGNICILSKAGGVYGEELTPTWSNGNSVMNVTADQCEYSIYEQDTDVVGGNAYSNIFTQPQVGNLTNRQSKIHLNESSVVTGGNLRDFTPITIKKSNNIIVASGRPNNFITDEGQNNRIILSGSQYFNGSWIEGEVDPNTFYTCEEIIEADQGLEGDLSGDCKVDIEDLSILASQWLERAYYASWYDNFDDGILDSAYFVHQNLTDGACTATEAAEYDYVEIFTNSPGGSLVQQDVKVELGDTVRTYFQQVSAWNNYSISAIGLTYDLNVNRYLDKSVAAFFLQNWRDNVIVYRHVELQEESLEIPNVGDPLGQTWVYEMVIGEDNGNGTFDITLSIYDLNGAQLGSSVVMTTSTPTGNMYWYCGDNRTLDRVYKLEIGKSLGPVTTLSGCENIILSGLGLGADISGNCIVDFEDLQFLASDWLLCIDPNDLNCVITQ